MLGLILYSLVLRCADIKNYKFLIFNFHITWADNTPWLLHWIWCLWINVTVKIKKFTRFQHIIVRANTEHTVFTKVMQLASCRKRKKPFRGYLVRCLTALSTYFSYIVAVSFIGGGKWNSQENHWTAASHWQTLSHNVV
jgi:hypothetical protein